MKQKNIVFSFIIFFTFIFSSCAKNGKKDSSTQHHLKQPISVTNAWVRIVPKIAKNSAIYMEIQNNSNQDDELLEVVSNISKYVELHNVSKKNGMMTMHQVSKINIPAKQITSLKPGSFHIMLIDLKEYIHKHSHVSVTLKFKYHPNITLNIPAKESGKNKSSMPHHHNMH